MKGLVSMTVTLVVDEVFQRWIIENSPPDWVMLIPDFDHAVMPNIMLLPETERSSSVTLGPNYTGRGLELEPVPCTMAMY
ncbi:hypothetical protein V6N13_044782 [Hibiscus sabdariffa]